MNKHMFLSGETSWRENLKFFITALRLNIRSAPAASPAVAAGTDNLPESDNASVSELLIRYDHIVIPGEIRRWIHNSRNPAFRDLGAVAFFELAKNKEPSFLQCLWWGAMSLYTEGLNDELNRIAIESQFKLSTVCNDPILKAYADFTAYQWTIRKAEQPRDDIKHAAAFPAWMADDLLLLEMTRATSELATIEALNRLLNNKRLATVYLMLAVDETSSTFDRLNADMPTDASDLSNDAPLVSVIVPVYNAGSALRTAMVSLMKQTWSKLQIIAVDDASTDGSGRVLDELAAQDSRIRVVRLERNSGAYLARNAGLAQSTGTFVTVADSDDWHHPQKIERQCRHLMKYPEIVANMSAGFRASEDLKPLARRRPFFKHVNLSSLMFRREIVVSTLGGWNAVRFGADTEFYNRLEMVFGKQALFSMDLPLFIARVREGSLTNDPLHGYFGHNVGARKEYVECYRHHQRSATPEQLRYSLDPAATMPFPVPMPALSRRVGTQACDAVYAGDLRDPAQATRAVRLHRDARMSGTSVRLLHIQLFNLDAENTIAPFLRDYLYKLDTTLLTIGEKVNAGLLVIHRSIAVEMISLQYPDLTFKAIKADDGSASELVNLIPISEH